MEAQSEIRDVMAAYLAAYRRGDAEGCAAAFAPDARLLSPYGPEARGRDAIAALHAAWVAEGAAGKTLEIVEAGGDGGVAWCLARFSEGAPSTGGASLIVLERQADGRWLIRMCSMTEAEG